MLMKGDCRKHGKCLCVILLWSQSSIYFLIQQWFQTEKWLKSQDSALGIQIKESVEITGHFHL